MSKNTKKIIGVTSPSIFSPEVQVMIEDYFEAVPLNLNQNNLDDLKFMASQCNAIILAGGSDVCPTFYGREITNHNRLRKFDFARDMRERELVKFAFTKKMPIAGICRGHQVLGLFHDIHLITDISGSDICHNPNSSEIQMGYEPVHYVRIVEKLQEEIGFKRTFVNSFHHQGLVFSKDADNERNENHVEVIGHANLNYNKDKSKETKIIEMMRGIENRWVSCQFHPEVDYQKNEASKWFVGEFKKMIG